MRIWAPIPALCLDRHRLIAEHHELHAIWTILTTDKKGYRNHPEVKRWKDHLPALARRHDLLVSEMLRRGYKHHSSISYEPRSASWPPTLQPIEHMRDLLAKKILSSLRDNLRSAWADITKARGGKYISTEQMKQELGFEPGNKT